MSDNDKIDQKRRKFLVGTTTAVGVAGAAFASVPFLKSMLPSVKTQAAGAPVSVDISGMKLGEQKTVEWRGRPVWILRRTKEQIDNLLAKIDDAHLRDPESNQDQQPTFAKNPYRSYKPEFGVFIGICTHLGCIPTYRPDIAPSDLGANWDGGFFCACHGSRFDLAGRVYKNVPAPLNLEVPPYVFLDDNTILVGTDTKPEPTSV